MKFIIVNKKLEEADFTRIGRLSKIRNAFFQTYLQQKPEEYRDLENVDLGSARGEPLQEFKFDKRLSVFRLY